MRKNLGKPFMEIVMEEGDMLYIPRGWPHAARNADGGGGGSASTHLTVGVHSYVYETLEGWLQRAATRWLATAAPLAKRRSRSYTRNPPLLVISGRVLMDCL